MLLVLCCRRVAHSRAGGGAVEVLGVENVHDREHHRAVRQPAVDAEGAGVLVPDAALGLGVEVRPVAPEPVLELPV